AKLKQKNVEIEDVRLLNYIDDFEQRDFDWETQTYRLSIFDQGKAILKSGKTWNLKFMVRYRDQAGNVKNTQVTYKVVVR
ncbi:MAG: hypothetical protein J1F41_05180, partial [Lachnospiraceae bacterium]|nr:hypothetical protein [Lachnospiraceae bacterium]